MPHKSLDEIQALLDGPVNSIPTPFLANGDLDWQGIGRIIESGIAAGSRVSLLTAGDSMFDFLTEREIADLTKCVVERTNGRTLTVAAVFRWWTGKMLDFARYCRDLGVDVLMVLPSERVTDPQGLIACYRAVAAIMPVMLVGYPPDAVLDGLTDTPAICAFKEDGTEAYAIRAIAKYGRTWQFITGGGYLRHYTQRPFGCRAYFSYLAGFAPHLARQFDAAILRRDEASLHHIMVEVERPFFELAGRYPGGFHAVWRATLELNGVAARGLRAPWASLSDADLERLRGELHPLGLI